MPIHIIFNKKTFKMEYLIYKIKESFQKMSMSLLLFKQKIHFYHFVKNLSLTHCQQTEKYINVKQNKHLFLTKK